MGLSHYSPLIRTVLVLQRLLADTKPSTVQTPDSTESCEKQIRHSEAILVLREHFGGLLSAAAGRIRVKLAATFTKAPGLPQARLEG